jgi:hypothetical protein
VNTGILPIIRDVQAISLSYPKKPLFKIKQNLPVIPALERQRQKDKLETSLATQQDPVSNKQSKTNK